MTKASGGVAGNTQLFHVGTVDGNIGALSPKELSQWHDQSHRPRGAFEAAAYAAPESILTQL